MSEADVDFAGLNRLAAVCHELASALPAASPPAGATTAFQPSAAVVAAIHGDAELVATRFAGRLQDTGGLLSSAAAGFRRSDTDNAARIRAVAPG